MNKAQVEECLAFVTKSYPGRFRSDPETSAIWTILMRDLDVKFAMAAVTHLCSSQDFPPAVSQIRKMSLYLVGGTWQVRHSENQEVLRSQFLKAYAEFMQRHDSEQCAIKEVKQLAEASKPAPPERLFAPPDNTDHDHTQDDDFTQVTPEMFREAIHDLNERISIRGR